MHSWNFQVLLSASCAAKDLDTHTSGEGRANLAEVVELLGNEESSALDLEALTNHGAVGPVTRMTGGLGL